jgi:membrane protein DedA with SNARE-associated domain
MDFLINFINDYGIFAMLLMVFLEYACFPVSSEIILPLAGAVALACGWSYSLMVICSGIAGLLGTYLVFVIARKASLKISCVSNSHHNSQKFKASKEKRNLKIPFFNKNNKIIGAASFSKSQFLIHKYGKFAVGVGRIVPLCRTYIAIPAGISSMSHGEYLIWSFSGILIWNSVLIGAGYYLGSHWNETEIIYQMYKLIICIAISICILVLLIRRFISRNPK